MEKPVYYLFVAAVFFVLNCTRHYSDEVKALIKKNDYQAAGRVLKENQPADSVDARYHLLKLELDCKAPGKYDRGEVLRSETILKNHGTPLRYDVRQQMLFDTCLVYKFHLGRILSSLEFLSGDILNSYEKLMIYCLENQDPWIRRQAVSEVAEFVRKDSTGLILLVNSKLQDSLSVEVKLEAAGVLAKKFKMDSGFKTVKAILEDTLAGVGNKARALDILGYMPDKKPQNIIKQYVKRDTALLRLYALGSLSQLGIKTDNTLIFNILNRKDDKLLKACLHNILKLNIIELPVKINPYLDHPDPAIRTLAITALARFEKTKAAPILLERYSAEPDIDVRAHIVTALGELRDIRAAPYLISLFNDPSEKIRNLVIFTLGNIGEHVIPIVIDSLASPSENVKKNGIVFLTYARSAEASKPLLRTFLGQDTDIASLAAEGLCNIRDQNLVDTLIYHINDPREFIAMQSIRILGETGNRKALGPLKQVKGKPEKEFQAKAAIKKIEIANKRLE